MRILFILLLVFQFNFVKADAINYLLKIPNLETYDLQNPNGLKYLTTKENFQIGVKNNISCEKLDNENLDNRFLLIKKNLDLYNEKFLKKINLRFIVLCQNLFISKINTAGIPDNVMKTLILDIKFNEKYFERVIHHEVFHIIHDQYKKIFRESDWVKFNDTKFEYAKCSTCTEKLGLDTYKKTKGFFTEYSKSTASEDMAEVFSHIIFLEKNYINNIRKTDSILNNKILYIKNKIKKIDNSFVF